jgi:sarcosine/dimethylglycine N-methyltransferase
MTSRHDMIAADRTRYRSFYDTQLSHLLSAIWGKTLHMGLFEEPGEPLGIAQQRATDHMARAAGLEPGDSVIEVACGVGSTAIHLAGCYGVTVHATNIAEAQLDEAAEHVRAANLSERISLGFADYHELPCPANSYDCWWCQEALLYATDRERVLAEARRAVKPEGLIVFTDLTLSRALADAERQQFGTDIRAPHLWAIDDYDRLLAKIGFTVRERQDWSGHVASTFAVVADNLARVRQEFADRIGEETVRGTEFRVGRQLDMARAGHLGWCFYALER